MRSVFLLLLLATASPAQFGDLSNAKTFAELATIEASVTPKSAKPGEVVTIKVTVALNLGAHTYPTQATTGQASLTTFRMPDTTFILVGTPKDPPDVKTKPGGKEVYYDAPATWELKAIVSPNAKAGKTKIDISFSSILGCTENGCYPATARDYPSLEFEVLAGSSPVPAEFADAVTKALTPPLKTVSPLKVTPSSEVKSAALHDTKKDALPLPEYQAKLDALAASLIKMDVKVANDLAGLLTAAIFWGFVSLVTPCVFPMIPITVSLFLKKSNQSTQGAVKLAAVYSLTIIVVLGLSAVALLRTFRLWSVSPEMNVFLGILFVVFALSLFGMYDIQLPGFLLRATERKRTASGGLVGTIFGALAFSIVSFTCVAPFLGGFAGIAATGNFSTFELTLAGLAFATAFASPFFVLALFPSLLKKLPRSGGWLETVKVVMGFLELAAAFKFFRTAELRRPPVDWFTYDVVLAAWVMIFAVCGAYLLGLFRLPHDDTPVEKLSVPRVGFAMLFLGLAIYLTPALFKQRPNGVVFAWVDSFLLPEAVPASQGDELPWSADLPGTLDLVRKERLKTGERKLVFVDFTGVTCTNCKYNEVNVFTNADVRSAMAKHALVQMYTDDVPAEFYRQPPERFERAVEARANLNFQARCFGTEQLPLYVLLEPLANGQTKVVSVYSEGKINNKDAFLAFLKTP